MAEDPGVSTIAALIESIRQAYGLLNDIIKTIFSGAVDMIRMGAYMRSNRGRDDTRSTHQMGQGGPHDLMHGRQSLRMLRQHEEHGAEILNKEIGTFQKKTELDSALRKLKIDYAITHNPDGTYLLHYKANNEKDIELAQALVDRGHDAKQARQEQAAGQETPPPPAPPPPSGGPTSHEKEVAEPPPAPHTADAPSFMYNRVQPTGDQLSGPKPAPKPGRTSVMYNKVQPDGQQLSGTTKEQNIADTIREEAAKEAATRLSDTQEAPASRTVRYHKAQPPSSRMQRYSKATQQRAARKNAPTRMQRHGYIQVPLDNLIQDAKIGAQAKNASRAKAQSTTPSRADYRKKRIKTRSYDLGH